MTRAALAQIEAALRHVRTAPVSESGEFRDPEEDWLEPEPVAETELVEFRGQPRDTRGRFAPTMGATGVNVNQMLRYGGGNVGPAVAALTALRGGANPSVMGGEVKYVMEVAARGDGHPDLTELRVEGQLAFGDEGLGIPRDRMPQLPEGPAREGFYASLEARGVKVTTVEINPRTLKPVQREISAKKAGEIYVAMEHGEYRASNHLTVTSDGYVIDGHHRWAASTAMAFKVPTTIICDVIDLPVREALSLAQSYTAEQGIATKGMGVEALFSEDDWALIEHLAGKHDQSMHAPSAAGKATGVVLKGIHQKGGGTYEPSTMHRITTGTVVARTGYSASHDRDQFLADPAYRQQAVSAYLRDHRDQFEGGGGKFGVWDSISEGGTTIVFDVVDVVSREEAIKLGKQRGEDGVYDLDRNEYIPTGGSTYT